jgi:hypothetical protein
VTDSNANKQKTATSDQKAGKGAGIQSGFMYADNLSRGRVGRGFGVKVLMWRERRGERTLVRGRLKGPFRAAAVEIAWRVCVLQRRDGKNGQNPRGSDRRERSETKSKDKTKKKPYSPAHFAVDCGQVNYGTAYLTWDGPNGTDRGIVKREWRRRQSCAFVSLYVCTKECIHYTQLNPLSQGPGLFETSFRHLSRICLICLARLGGDDTDHVSSTVMAGLMSSGRLFG